VCLPHVRHLFYRSIRKFRTTSGTRSSPVRQTSYEVPLFPAAPTVGVTNNEAEMCDARGQHIGTSQGLRRPIEEVKEPGMFALATRGCRVNFVRVSAVTLVLALVGSAVAQTAPAKPAVEKPAEKPAEKQTEKPVAQSTTTTPATKTTTKAEPKTEATPADTAVVFRSTGIAPRDTLLRMMTPVTAEFENRRLEDVINFIKSVTSADLEVMWADDKNSNGLDKDTEITAKANNLTMLRFLEIVLERAAVADTALSSTTTMPTWQMSDSGAMQIGPRTRLNAFKRVEVYPVSDLLLETPDYDNVPEFDLQQALQSGQSGGGGGGQSPFTDADGEDPARRPTAEKADELRTLLQELVEPDQWQDRGGEGASLRFFLGAFIVNGPDYVHRQLNGYPYWPAGTRAMKVNGRRYVTLGSETATSAISGFEQVPVTTIVR
jgi:hypothetical protein